MRSEDISKWCDDRGLRIGSDRSLYYKAGTECCFSVGLKDAPARIIALADHLVPTWEDRAFEGALLWIRQRGIWGDYSEKVGAMIVRQMCKDKDGAVPLDELPGFLFDPQELFEMHSYFLVPMLFGWDAFLVPERRDYFLFVSHDSVVGVVSRTQQQSSELYRRVLDWKPREARAWYFKR